MAGALELAKMAGAARVARGKAKGVAIATGEQSISAPKVRVKSDAAAGQGAVVMTMTVVVGAGMLRSWVVDKTAMPDRSYFIKMAVLGFILALMTETMPRLGKGMSYLVLTATVFAQAGDIFQGLQAAETPAAGPPGTSAPGVPRRRTFTVASSSKGRSDPHKQDWPRPHANILPPNTA